MALESLSWQEFLEGFKDYVFAELLPQVIPDVFIISQIKVWYSKTVDLLKCRVNGLTSMPYMLNSCKIQWSLYKNVFANQQSLIKIIEKKVQN